MRFILDGIEIDRSEYTGSQGVVIEAIKRDEAGKPKKSLAQEFTLSGSAYDQVYNAFIGPDANILGSLPVKIYETDCCTPDQLVFEGVIKGEGVSWCYDVCTVDVTLTEQTTQTKRMDCVKSTLVYDDKFGFQQQSHPRVVYCIEVRPDFLQHLFLIFGILTSFAAMSLAPIILVVQALVSTINLVIDGINGLIPGGGSDIQHVGFGNDPTGPFALYQQYLDQLNQRLIGCGRKHPSPFVRSYAVNACTICDLKFVSSIYNDPASDYYQTMYLNAPVEKGTLDESLKYIVKNAPLKTLDIFLDELALAHNAEWRLIDDTIYFERKDFFYTGDTWINFLDLDNAGLTTSELCVQKRTENNPAIASFGYTGDPVDIVGNEALDRFKRAAVEWNLPFNQLQVGHKEYSLPFGTARTRDDGIDDDIYAAYSTIPLATISDAINSYQSVMTLEKGTCFIPKLIIWDGVDGSFARIKKYNIPGWGLNANINYNFPFMFNIWDGVAMGEIPENNLHPPLYPTNHPNSGLYIRFFSIDNPKRLNDKGLQWSFSFKYSCEQIKTYQDADFVQLPMGIGRIVKITIDLTGKIMTVNGFV